VKFCLKMGRPLPKPKYSLMTDSEPVPLGKDQKDPDRGNEIVSETECLQAVRASLRSDGIPFV